MSKLLRTGIFSLVLAIALVEISYYYIDRPFAFFIYDHQINHILIFKYLTYIGAAIYYLSPIFLVYFVIRFCLTQPAAWEWALSRVAAIVIIAIYFKDILKYVFGRTWPQTWINNNPSLIQNNAFGFHWFHGGVAYAAFPSGHSTVSVAFATALWLSFPKLRWLAVLIPTVVIIGLLGKNYHFVSDIIGGSFLGGLIAFYAIKISAAKS